MKVPQACYDADRRNTDYWVKRYCEQVTIEDLIGKENV